MCTCTHMCAIASLYQRTWLIYNKKYILELSQNDCLEIFSVEESIFISVSSLMDDFKISHNFLYKAK
jgi:hypothetical protein